MLKLSLISVLLTVNEKQPTVGFHTTGYSDLMLSTDLATFEAIYSINESIYGSVTTYHVFFPTTK